jgi:predicted alpha/beta-hydrolase family hydrolase
MATVIFAHGLEGRPDGTKATALRAAGLEVVAPDGRGLPLAARIAQLEDAVSNHPGAVLVGSSYGGLAALVVADAGRAISAVVLCAPALSLHEAPLGHPEQLCVPANVRAVVIHGKRDEVVPVEVSCALAARCPHVELHITDDVHDLRGSLDLLVSVVRRLAG